MRTMTALAAAAALSLSSPYASSAHTFNVESGGVTYSFEAGTTGEMPFNAGQTITIGSRTFELQALTRIYVDNSEVENNTVEISYSGDNAGVRIAGNIAAFVDVTIVGAHVTITQSSEVSDSTCGEITYVLSGESSDGSFSMTGNYKASLELHGLTLTNPRGAVIDIQNGKRIGLSAKNGTVNSLTDGKEGDQKGCIVCKGHLEFKGKGELNVAGKKSHAVYAKEYVSLKNQTLKITEAKKDGINCNQYFLQESGILKISGIGDDGIQTSFKDDTDRDAEDTGSITIAGGKLTIIATANAAKGLKADGYIAISGGDLDISVSGNGIWDDEKVKTKASACLGCDGDLFISGGTLHLTATGSGGKGINCDGDLSMSGGNLEISTTGGLYAYINGTEYHSYTGNTDRIDSSLRSSAKGVKADGTVIISGGKIHVVTTGYAAEGIESKKTLTISGGEIYAWTYDDAINSSSHMYIDGGDITVIATHNDGLDSNGNLYIRGGRIRAFGAGSPECGIDANEEEGYTVIFTGGELLAVGGNNSVPRGTDSTQAYISGNGRTTAGSLIAVKSGNTTLVEFTVPDEYISSGGRYAPGGGWWPGGMDGGGMLVSCPGMEKSQTYTLVNGSSSSTLTAR